MWKTTLLIVAVLGVVLFNSSAHGQAITVNSGYAGGPPQTANPSGVWSVPAGQANLAWQIVVDFGTLTNGNFTLYPGGPPAPAPFQPGGAPWTGAVVGLGPPPWPWGAGNFNLGAVGGGWPGAPNVAFVRARLQTKVNGVWTTKAVAVNGCP